MHSSPAHTIDLLILTAANAAQAAGYEAQLAARERTGGLSGIGGWMVLPDPRGARVGSGAATLLALASAARRFGGVTRLAARSVLILHSGGDSRRLPAYAAQGKIFAPLREGRNAALFDLLLDDLRKVMPPDRILIGAGDLLLNVSRESGLDLGGPGVVCVAKPDRYERASRHGVFIADVRGKVTGFLQKPTREAARASGAMRPDGTLLVDTGLVSLDASVASEWLTRAGCDRGGVVRRRSLLARMAEARSPLVDLYEHMHMALVPGVTEVEYLARVNTDGAQAAALRDVFAVVGGPALRVAVAPWCEFLHIGSTTEYLSVVRSPKMAGGEYKNAAAGLLLNSAGFGLGYTPPRGGVVESCLGGPGGVRGLGVNLVVGLPRVRRVRLSKGAGLVALPIGARQWTVIAFGAGDDCKTPAPRGGTFMSRTLHHVLRVSGLATNRVWDLRADGSLWSAKFWIIGPYERALKHALSAASGRIPRATGLRSMAEVMPRVNHARLIAQREAATRAARFEHLGRDLMTDDTLPALDVVDEVLTRTDAARARAGVLAVLDQRVSGGRRARLARAVELLDARFPVRRGPAIDSLAEVRKAGSMPVPRRHPPRAEISHDQVVWVAMPVRIDLAGGWTDTPPICHDVGGSVVNMAVTLNGQHPVQVVVKRREDNRFRISSIDLGVSTFIKDSAEAGAFSNPHEWTSLAKAALTLCGYLPRGSRVSLSGWARSMGGGLDLTLFSALPKGSGLGTSSVLGAGIIAALDRISGAAFDADAIMQRTSTLEQMMTTGGGWQDQAGGLLPGIKLLRTEPGQRQVPDATVLGLPTGLGARCLLYYTGMRRLARDILQKVVYRYLERDRDSLTAIRRLKAGAEAMADALRRADTHGFITRMAEYGELKRSIDPGSTNELIESIVRPIAGLLDAYELTGAGGGGFLFMVAKSPTAAASVRAELVRHPPNALARFFDFALDEHGPRISVM